MHTNVKRNESNQIKTNEYNKTTKMTIDDVTQMIITISPFRSPKNNNTIYKYHIPNTTHSP